MSKYPGLTKAQSGVYELHEVEVNPDTGKTYTHGEIAVKLKISQRTSETLLYQARQRLKDMKTTLEKVKEE